jgi:hypothetical protein
MEHLKKILEELKEKDPEAFKSLEETILNMAKTVGVKAETENDTEHPKDPPPHS